MTGRVFSIEEFSVYDGPGIRTSVFLKGCPLRCAWCHNPEGQNKEIEIVRSLNGCLSCGNCERNGILVDEKIIYTEKSIESCPRHLLRFCGEDIESSILCERIMKNKTILNASGGGVTFSGGEPTMQSDFLIECLKTLKGQLHCAIQTCGHCDPSVFAEILSQTEYVLFDLKIVDEALHRRYTGVDNALILENFDILVKSRIPFVIRVPLIPTVTDTKSNISAISKLLEVHNINYVELLPYNKMAGGKYSMLGREYNVDFDENKTVDAHSEIFASYGIKTNIL